MYYLLIKICKILKHDKHLNLLFQTLNLNFILYLFFVHV